MDDLKYIIESLLFVSEEPLGIETIRRVTDCDDTKRIRQALTELTDEYRQRNGGFYLAEVAGGFQLRTPSRFTAWIGKLIEPDAPRLSRAALETLAIIAYKQPVIRSDVEQIRGVDSGGVLRMLMERKLIRILGRKEIPGRPLIYATTKLFLQVFDLRDLKDLPSPKEIEAMVARTRPDDDRQDAEEGSEDRPETSEDGLAADPNETWAEGGQDAEETEIPTKNS